MEENKTTVVRKTVKSGVTFGSALPNYDLKHYSFENKMEE